MIDPQKIVAKCFNGHEFIVSWGLITDFRCPICGSFRLTLSPMVITKEENEVIKKRGRPPKNGV